jgi:hypothetical protein
VCLFSILCILCFLCIVSPFVYRCLCPTFVQVYRPLPPGGNPITGSKHFIISYHIISYIIWHVKSYHIISYHVISYIYHVISYHMSAIVLSHVNQKRLNHLKFNGKYMYRINNLCILQAQLGVPVNLKVTATVSLDSIHWIAFKCRWTVFCVDWEKDLCMYVV